MDVIVSNTFGSLFYTVSALLVLWVIWHGYYRDHFFSTIAQSIVVALVLFTVLYLGYRFGTGYTQTRIATEVVSHQFYTWLAALHGIISLWAIVQTSYVFMVAKRYAGRGENYFRKHKKLMLLMVLLWPLMVLSGILL